jgi:hypothetical protein
MSNLHCYPSFLHNLLIHEFYHCLPKVISPMFFVVFWDYQKLKQLGFITSYSNMGCLCYNKLHNLPCFLSCHPIYNLGNKIFIVVRNKKFLILDIPTNFGILSISFLHISFNILVSFLVTCMLTKKISQVRASNLPFLSTSL